MRTAGEMEAMRQHPASGTAVEERADPYQEFLTALEDLEMVKSLHGSASEEVRAARAHVRAARKRATGAWRRTHAA